MVYEKKKLHSVSVVYSYPELEDSRVGEGFPALFTVKSCQFQNTHLPILVI